MVISGMFWRIFWAQYWAFWAYVGRNIGHCLDPLRAENLAHPTHKRGEMGSTQINSIILLHPQFWPRCCDIFRYTQCLTINSRICSLLLIYSIYRSLHLQNNALATSIAKMSSTTSTTTSKYSSPRDWTKWNFDFTNRAKSLNLWEHIDPRILKPWPERPIAPEIEDYEARPIQQSNVAESSTTAAGRMQTRGLSRTATLGSNQSANRLVPISIAELTSESKADYQHDWTTYLHRDKKFDKFETNLHSLKT